MTVEVHIIAGDESQSDAFRHCVGSGAINYLDSPQRGTTQLLGQGR
jgi:hypothetical protein